MLPDPTVASCCFKTLWAQLPTMQYWDPDIRQLAQSADHSLTQPIMWPPNHSPSITLVWCFNYTISFNHSIYSITFNGDIDPNITHYNPLYNHWFIFKNPIDGNPCGTPWPDDAPGIRPGAPHRARDWRCDGTAPVKGTGFQAPWSPWTIASWNECGTIYIHIYICK